MKTADVEDRVAAQEIEVIPIIHVVEVSPFRPRIDLVETDDALSSNQRSVEVPLMQLVVLAQARSDDLF